MRLLAVLALGALILAPLPSRRARRAAPKQPSQEAQSRGAMRQGEHSPKAIRRPARAMQSRRRGGEAARAAVAPGFHRRRPGRRNHSGHPGRALLGQLREGFPRRASGDARSLACAVDRRRRRRIRRRPAQRLVGIRQAAGVFRRHRRQHRRADGALCVRRLGAGPGLKRAYTEYNAGDIFEDVKTPESLVDTWPLKRADRQGSHPRTARAGRRGAQARAPPVRRDHQSRRPARRGVEHGRDRRQGRRGRAEALPRRARAPRPRFPACFRR